MSFARCRGERSFSAGGGSGVFVWLGLEVGTITLFGLLVSGGAPWAAAAKYLAFRGVGGASIFWGLAGGNEILVWVGLYIKLGMPPGHI